MVCSAILQKEARRTVLAPPKVAYHDNIEKHKQSVRVLKVGWETATGWRENVNLVGPMCAKRQNTQGIIVNIVSCERWQNSID